MGCEEARCRHTSIMAEEMTVFQVRMCARVDPLYMLKKYSDWVVSMLLKL